MTPTITCYNSSFFIHTILRKDDSMNIDIRKSITANFQDSPLEEFREAIESSIQAREEMALPGLGVFFEVLWKSSTEEEKEKMLNQLKKNLV